MKIRVLIFTAVAGAVAWWIMGRAAPPSELPGSVEIQTTGEGDSRKPRRHIGRVSIEDAAPLPAGPVTTVPGDRSHLAITVRLTTGSLTRDPVFVERKEGERVPLSPLPSSEVAREYPAVRRYEFQPVAVGSTVSVFHGEQQRDIEITAKSEYEVVFDAVVSVEFIIEGRSPVFESAGNEYEIRVREDSGRLRKASCRDRVTMMLRPGDYDVQVYVVSAAWQDAHVKVIGDRLRMDLSQGNILKVGANDTALVHRVVLDHGNLCKLTVTGVGPEGVSLSGPIEQTTKGELRHSMLSPESVFWVGPGTYYLYAPSEQLANHQRVLIRNGDRVRQVEFRPSPIAGVRLMRREDAAEDASCPFRDGDVIRGLDGKIIGRDMTFKEYAGEVVRGMLTNRTARFTVERISGKTEEFEVRIGDTLRPLGKVYRFRPVTQ